MQESANLNEEERPKGVSLQRIISIDWGRGFALFVVLIVHAANYWAFPLMPSTPNTLESDKSIWLAIILLPFQILGSWASIFAVLTGASTAYVNYYLLVKRKASIKNRIKGSLISAIILLIIHFIYSYFFIYPTFSITGETHQGLVPGSIKALAWNPPPLDFLLISGPLSMIVFSDVFVTFISVLIWRKVDHSQANIKRSMNIFAILGIAMILCAEFVKAALIPVLNENYAAERYLITTGLVFLVGTKHCIFPFVGYAFLGGMIGVGLMDSPKNVVYLRKWTFGLGSFFIVLAIGDAVLHGVPELVGPYHPFFLYTLNMGLQLYTAAGITALYEQIASEDRKNYKRYYFLVYMRRMSTISLTLFLTEQTVAAIYTWIFIIIAPKLMENVLFIFFIYVPILILIWFELIDRWERHNYKYSIEWVLACLMKGKKINTHEDILGVQKFIYINSGFPSREAFYEIKKANKNK